MELVLVMAIIGIVSMIAIPRYSGATLRYRAELTAQRIAADLQFAKATARHTNQAVTITFDAGNDSYTMPTIDDLDNSAEKYAIDLTETPFRVDLVSAQFGPGPFVSQVTFDAFGEHDLGGTITISAGSHQRQIVLDAATGSITTP